MSGDLLYRQRTGIPSPSNAVGPDPSRQNGTRHIRGKINRGRWVLEENTFQVLVGLTPIVAVQYNANRGSLLIQNIDTVAGNFILIAFGGPTNAGSQRLFPGTSISEGPECSTTIGWNENMEAMAIQPAGIGVNDVWLQAAGGAPVPISVPIKQGTWKWIISEG